MEVITYFKNIPKNKILIAKANTALANIVIVIIIVKSLICYSYSIFFECKGNNIFTITQASA